jgi:hypothetical protein
VEGAEAETEVSQSDLETMNLVELPLPQEEGVALEEGPRQAAGVEEGHFVVVEKS